MKAEELKVGDKVMCTDKFDKELNEFVSTNVGEFIGIDDEYFDYYLIKYENVPEELQCEFVPSAAIHSEKLRNSVSEKNIQYETNILIRRMTLKNIIKKLN